eukprot:1485601-Amphidinium_carterae.1
MPALLPSPFLLHREALFSIMSFSSPHAVLEGLLGLRCCRVSSRWGSRERIDNPRQKHTPKATIHRNLQVELKRGYGHSSKPD